MLSQYVLHICYTIHLIVSMIWQDGKTTHLQFSDISQSALNSIGSNRTSALV